MVPHGLAVRASGSMVYLYAGNVLVGGTAAVPIVEDEDDGGTLCERLFTVVHAVLGTAGWRWSIPAATGSACTCGTAAARPPR